MTSPFKYTNYPPNKRDAKLRPIIRAKLMYKQSLDFDSIIDSGADITISFEEIGRARRIDFDDPASLNYVHSLGLNFRDEICGLGKEPISVYTFPIEVEVNNKKQTVCIRWIRNTMGPNSDFPVILGQDSIFLMFDIHFSKRQSLFFLNEEELKHD